MKLSLFGYLNALYVVSFKKKAQRKLPKKTLTSIRKHSRKGMQDRLFLPQNSAEKHKTHWCRPSGIQNTLGSLR